MSPSGSTVTASSWPIFFDPMAAFSFANLVIVIGHAVAMGQRV